MTITADPSQRDDETEDFPLVVCVALDNDRRERLAALLDGVGVVVFAQDIATAHSMLGRQLTLGGAAAGSAPSRPSLLVDELEIDKDRCRVTWRGAQVELSRRERDLLACLASEPTRVWSYRQLYDAVWEGRYLDPGPVHAAIKRLRRKLRHAGVTVQIEASRGVGYELTYSATDTGGISAMGTDIPLRPGFGV